MRNIEQSYLEGGALQRKVPSVVSLADTPESTIYIKKKQFRSHRDGWFFAELYKKLPIFNQFAIDILGRLFKNKLAILARLEQQTKWSKNVDLVDRILYFVNLGGYHTVEQNQAPRELPLTGAVITSWFVESDVDIKKTPRELLEDIQSKLEGVSSNGPQEYRTTMIDLQNGPSIGALEGIGIPMDGFLRSPNLNLAKQRIGYLLDATREDMDTNIVSVATSMVTANDSIIVREFEDPSVGRFNGVIEFANISTISTSISLDRDGIASFSLVNPLDVMRITGKDIDKAISDVLEDVTRVETGIGKDILLREFREAHIEYNRSLLEGLLPATDSLIGYSYASDVNYGIGLLQDPYQDQIDSFLENVELQKVFGGADANALKSIKQGLKILRADLFRHLVGHHIIESHDQIYIWLTSPTRVIASAPEAIQQMLVEEQSLSWQLEWRLSEIISSPPTSTKVAALKQEFNDLLIKQRALRSRIREVSNGELISRVACEEILHDVENQVFEGIVAEVRSNYQAEDGTYTLEVSCKDVLEWARMTSSILKPSFAATNAETNDPIQKIGEGENKLYLWKSGMLVKSLEARHATSGYTIPRILEDIPTYALASEIKSELAAKQVAPLEQIYSNLSAANIISLQLTGEPYNLGLFLKNSEFLGMGRFFSLFKDFMQRQNDTLGEFEPFKLIVDSSCTVDIREKLQDLQELVNFVQFGLIDPITHNYEAGANVRPFLDPFDNPEYSQHKLYRKMIALKDSGKSIYKVGTREQALVILENIKSRLSSDTEEYEYSLAMIEEYILGLDFSEAKTAGEGESIIYMQHKEALRSHKVDIVRGINRAASRDYKRNFLVITSLYDINEPLRAFEQALSSSLDRQIWDSEFSSPYTLCKEVASAVDFEFFTDSQGNIIFRPPEYNRVPIEFLWQYENVMRNINELTGLEESGEIDEFFQKTKDIYKDVSILNEQLRLSEAEGEIEELAKIRTKFQERLKDLLEQVRVQKSKILAFLTDESRIHRIRPEEMISYSTTDGPPDFTHLVVNGAPRTGPLEIGTPIYFTAWGVDFDLWRSYGFITQTVSKPFLHDSIQATNYCQFLLGRQRGRIFKGTLVVRGDSKYQLGDTVYIQSLHQLFYVTGISHSFTYGTSYQTTLNLEYGRYPGMYIPHPFEAVGRMLIQYEERFNIRQKEASEPRPRVSEEEVQAMKKNTKGAISDLIEEARREPETTAGAAKPAPVSPKIEPKPEIVDPTSWLKFAEGGKEYRILTSGLIEIKDEGINYSKEDVAGVYEKYKSQIQSASQKTGISEEMILATILTESSGRPDKVVPEFGFYLKYVKDNPKWKANKYYNEPDLISASYGLMQVMYTESVDDGFKGTVSDLLEPGINIFYGATFIAGKKKNTKTWKIEDHINPVGLALAYNAGSKQSDNTNKWGVKMGRRHLDRFIANYNGALRYFKNGK